MAVTVTNPQDIFNPVVDQIAAHTASMESLAACQAQAQVDIARTPICEPTSAADLIEVTCTTETLPDTPAAGDSTIRETCSDGKVTDMITYADGTTETVEVSGANPQPENVGYDENGRMCATDMVMGCDPSIPTDYFIPKYSDFGNEIWCVPGYTYGFAWSGVNSKNIKEQLANFDLNELNDINLPAGGGDSIRAEVGGVPYMCDGAALHPLQEAQSLKLEGCYAEMGTLCIKEEGEAASSVGGDISGFGDLFNLDPGCPDIAGKPAQDAYYTLWHDWWCCEKRSKRIQQAIYWGQLPVALLGLITSIDTYNKLLDKNLDMICASQEDLDLVAKCSAELIGEEGILKECQNNLLAGHMDRIAIINDRGTHSCSLADSELDCYDKLWKPIQADHAPHLASNLHTMLNNGKHASEISTSWADGLQECITENMLPELKRQFAPLIGSVNCTSNNLNQWREDLKAKAANLHDHFNQTYKCNEANMIPVIMDMTTCMVERTCELRDWLYDCAKADQDVYHKGYQNGEIPQAQAAMATSAQLIPKIVKSVEWLDKHIPYAQDIFKTCYGEPQSKLNPLLYSEATELAPEITRCYEWFRDNATDYQKFFKECYEDRECRLVKSQLDLACRLTSRLEESLERVTEWSLNDRDMFVRHFKTEEIEGLQRVAHNGHGASDELTRLSEWFTDRTHEFHDTYHQTWLPADIDSLKRHCDIWTRHDPLQGIERDNTHLGIIADELEDFHSNGLALAKTYMGEVFEKADRFDYCIENPAALHVRSQVDLALDQLEMCTSKYARGHLLAAQAQLKAAGIRAEGSAVESATRWKWWANEQLNRREFEQRIALMGIMDSAAGRAIAATGQRTAGYDLLLNHHHQALLRGQTYLAHMQEAGRTASNIDQNQVDSLLRAVQLWHFWPELALRENNEFNQQHNALMDDAQNLLQFGHNWLDRSNTEKNGAVNVMTQSFDVATRLSQLGQFYFQQAGALNGDRTQAAVQAGTLGNQYAQTGHNLHRLAADKAGNALQQSINSAQMGLGAGDLGHKHNALALEIENKMTLNALEHLKAGISAFAIGIDFLQEVRQSQQLSGSYGINAANSMLNVFKHGQNSGLMSLTANEQCFDTNYQMLCKAKDFVQKNHQLNMQALHGDNLVGSTNNLISQQGDAVGSAFGLLGNSLQGISQNTASPPFPSGSGAFGFNGGGF